MIFNSGGRQPDRHDRLRHAAQHDQPDAEGAGASVARPHPLPDGHQLGRQPGGQDGLRHAPAGAHGVCGRHARRAARRHPAPTRRALLERRREVCQPVGHDWHGHAEGCEGKLLA